VFVGSGFEAMMAKLIKFSAVGALGTLAHYSVLIFLVQILYVNVLVATSIGAFVGALVNYVLNYKWTFNSNKRHSEAMVKFFVVASVGFVMNGLFMTLFTQALVFHYLIAQIVTTGIVLFWNFLANHYWTFDELSGKS
jgi:putative flippase GtrA